MTQQTSLSKLQRQRERMRKALDALKKIYNENGEVWLGDLIKELDPDWKSRWDLITEEVASISRHITLRTPMSNDNMIVDKFLGQYPFIGYFVITMACANGAINRLESAEYAVDRAYSVLGAEGVVTEDVELLEKWMGTLTLEQIDTLADGELSEIEELMNKAPTAHTGSELVSSLLTDLWEELCDKG